MIRRPYLLLGFSMLAWGVANPLSDIALEGLPVGVMFGTEVASGAFLLGWWALLRRRSLGRLPWRWVLLLGMLEPGLTYLFGNIGYAGGTVVTGLIIMSSETLLLAGLGWLVLGERIARGEGMALLAGFGGASLVGFAATEAGVGTPGSNLAFAAAALAAAGYALAVRRLAQQTEGLDTVGLAFGQALVAVGLAAVTAPFTWELGNDITAATPMHWLAAAGAGIFGVALPFVWFAAAAAHIPSRHAALALNIIPVVGIGIGAGLGRGLPTSLQLLGGLLVLGSLFALDAEAASR